MTWVPDAAETALGFEARRLGVTTLRGRFDRFAVTIPADATAPGGWGLDLRVGTASVSTGNAARDARLAGTTWLDAVRYPEIVFRSRRIEPLHDIDNSLTRVGGDLTVRGRTREANWEFELLARAQGETGALGAQYVGRLEFVPRKWGLGSAHPLVGPIVTITLRLLVLAADRGEERRVTESAPEEIFTGATSKRRSA
jgi:polyisoprenoid-binding protein YceI